MIQVVIDSTTNDGAVRLRLVQRWQGDWLLCLEETAELLECRCRLRQPQDRDAVPIADRHRVVPCPRPILLDDESVDQFDGGVLAQESRVDGPVVLLDRPRHDRRATRGSFLENRRHPPPSLLTIIEGDAAPALGTEWPSRIRGLHAFKGEQEQGSRGADGRNR